MQNPDYRRIFEEATEYAIFTMDLDSKITSWNRGAEKLLGWSEDEAIGQSGDIIFPDGEKEDVETELKRVREEGRAMDERWHVKKDGRKFFAIGRTLGLTGDSGKIEGYIKILLDQTKRKKNEQQLKEMNEKLEERVEERTRDLEIYRDKLRSLVAELNRAEEQERRNLAGDLHDNLGQLLAMCKIELNLFQSTLPHDIDTTNLKNTFSLLEQATRYTRKLMSELKPPAELEKKDLKSNIDWLINKIKDHGIHVTIEDDGKPKPVSIEIRRALLQAVRELLFNVKKHAGVDDAIIFISRKDHHLHVKVKDEGKGFEYDKKEQEKNIGGGFGLFNLKERLDLLGGKLEINSKPGEGTAVTVMAPLDE